MKDITRKDGVLICFTGIDGSGKTTLSKYLKTSLNDLGIPCDYLWWFEADSSGFRKLLRFIAFGKVKSRKTDNQKAKEVFKKNRLFSEVSQLLVLSGYFYQAISRVWIPMAQGKTVVCDRYIYDVLVSFTVESGYSNERFNRMMRRVLRIFPRPDLVFLLDVPEEISFRRKDDVFHPTSLSKPRIIYSGISKQDRYKNMLGTEMVVVDGTSDLESLKQVVKVEAFKLLEK